MVALEQFSNRLGPRSRCCPGLRQQALWSASTPTRSAVCLLNAMAPFRRGEGREPLTLCAGL